MIRKKKQILTELKKYKTDHQQEYGIGVLSVLAHVLEVRPIREVILMWGCGCQNGEVSDD